MRAERNTSAVVCVNPLPGIRESDWVLMRVGPAGGAASRNVAYLGRSLWLTVIQERGQSLHNVGTADTLSQIYVQ